MKKSSMTAPVCHNPEDLELGSLQAEVARLNEEIAELRGREAKNVHYVREKVDQLLQTVGTCPLRPEELDDQTLITLDPIGIINDTFTQILAHLRETNHRLALAHSEIAAIFNAAGAGILVLDGKKRILSYNRKLQESFFPHLKDAIGCRCSEVICRAEGMMSECVFEKVALSCQGEHRSDILFDKRHYDVVGVPLLSSGRTIDQVILVYNEITEQKLAEEALRDALAEARDARSKLDAILHSVSDPLVVVNREDRVVLVNRAAEELLGVCLYDPFGLALEKAISDPALLAQFRGALCSGEMGWIDFSLHGEGGERSFRGRTSPLRDAGGNPAGTVLLLHEMTKERAVDRMKSEFISTAAHELQTPLTAVIGFADLLLTQEDLSLDVRRESLRFIQQKAEVLSGIVDDLLDLGRIEAGRELGLVLEETDISQLIQMLIRSYDLRTGRHRLAISLPKDPVRLQIDVRRISQVLENILSNAVKYSPNGGQIRVTGRVDGENFHLTVADNGIGMSSDQLERVFERFYRGDTSNTSIGGTGLGMSIARHIIEAHGGQIWVESKPGKGTRVHFLLPLKRAAEG